MFEPALDFRILEETLATLKLIPKPCKNSLDLEYNYSFIKKP